MSIDAIKDRLPDYAKDLKLNLGGLFNQPGMSDTQLYGTALAAAYAVGNGTLLRAIADVASAKLSAEAQAAAKGAAAIMGMNNIYYRFVHLVDEPEYATLPARLRMNIIARPGVDKQDFELFALAVSAINGCGMCIDSHEKVVTQAGLSKQTVQNAVRIAAVIHAVARVLDAEAELSTRAAAAE